MTFNSSQQERLLAALERIADALERAHPTPQRSHEDDVTRLQKIRAPYVTDTPSTKGPYR